MRRELSSEIRPDRQLNELLATALSVERPNARSSPDAVALGDTLVAWRHQIAAPIFS
jgi:hypothetical protein